MVVQLAIAKTPDLLLDLIDVAKHDLYYEGRVFNFYSWIRKPDDYIQPQLERLAKLASDPSCIAHRSVHPFLSEIPLVSFASGPMLPALNLDRRQLGLQLCSGPVSSPEEMVDLLEQTRERLMDEELTVKSEEHQRFITDLQAVWCDHPGVNYLAPFYWQQVFMPPDVSLQMLQRCFFRCRAFPIFSAATTAMSLHSLETIALAGYPEMPDGVSVRWTPTVIVDEGFPLELEAVPILNNEAYKDCKADLLNGYLRDARGRIIADCGHIYSILVRTRSKSDRVEDLTPWIRQLVGSCKEAAVPIFLASRQTGVQKT